MIIKSFIQHRVNTVLDLAQLDTGYGAEIDLRDRADHIILNHEPFACGDSIHDYLDQYKHGTCILNTKTDGLEDELIRLMAERQLNDYFFLDTTVPTMVKYINRGFRKIAVRFSEYEPLAFVKQFELKAEWVWVDCFTRNVLTHEAYEYLSRNFKICIVSPELQGHAYERITEFKNDFQGFEIDAVCTKKPELWK